VQRAVSGDEIQEDEGVILRPDLEAAPNKKLLAVDPALECPFLDQQAAHQKTTEHEEDVDTCPAKVIEAQPPEGRK